MRKILLVLSLSVLFMISGCGSGGENVCSFSNLTPGATYLIFITSSSGGIPLTLTRVASSSGTISISTPVSCSNVTAVLATNSNLSLSASPSSIYLPEPPATVTITGQSFDTTYGMPRVEYFHSDGYLVGSVLASSVSSDGTSLLAYTPGLSSAYSGTYHVRVTNKTYQGYYAHVVGSATMTAWGRDRYDSDGDGWYDDEDCDPWDPYVTSCSGTCEETGPPFTLCGPIE